MMASDGDSTNEDPVLVGDDEVQLQETEAATTRTTPKTTAAVSFEFIDHFSLRQPSSTIRSRGVTTRIYDVDNNQLQLEQRSEIVPGDEEHNKNEVKIVTTMKRLGGNNPGLIFLRICYTLVALLMAGFTFVFISTVIVMQTMEIPRNSGQAAGASLNVPIMVANVLALPLLVYSMSSLMIFCLIFVGDTWNGHVMFRLLLPTQVPRLYLEWYSFILYMGVPMLILCIAAFVGADNTKEIGGLAWYCCILISFLIFCALVFYNEVKLCLDLTRYWHPDLRNLELLKQAVLTTVKQRYCGVEEKYFLVRKGGGELRTSTLNDSQPLRTHRSLYSRLTSLSRNPFFLPVSPPSRRFSIEELQETVPIVTNQSWSLDKACCGLRNGRSEVAVHGEDAIEPRQSKSGLICSILGINLGCLVAVAFLYSAGILTGGGAIVIVYVVLLILLGLPCSWSAYRVYRAMTLPQAEDEDDNEETIFQSWASFTVTQPKKWYCWLRLIVAFGLFFLWPAISLFANGLPKFGVIFLFTSIFSVARLNLDAGSILREHSSLLVEVNFGEDKSSQQQMVARARAAQVLTKITNSALYFIAIIGFGFMGGFFIYFAGSSAGSGEDYNTQTGREPIRLLDDFYYPPQNQSMLYPNCKLTNHFALPAGLDNTYALDYNFLAGIAYETTDVSIYLIDKWFGQSSAAIDEADFVTQWRKDSGNSLEQVSFKLFSFPSSPGVGILSIRGTETSVDRMFNAQLYLGSVLTQLIRAFMPFSWIWDSIYDDLLATTSWVASDHLQKSDYYRITTDFVNDLLLNNYTIDGKNFQWLRTTGVSLGGGLALITGAQTDAYAFAYSGPNPTLARKTWDPPITMEQLSHHVINIKPENDFVSSIGDVVPNHQLVQCRDWPAKVHNCHSFWRIFCEYMFTCGSPVDRSGAFCDCADKWGYPKPIPRGNRTFEQACAEEEAAMKDSLGDIFKEIPWLD
ncbi:hypothetical protein ACHAXR_010204 [Thalassiosira sp. AJA248-18]